MLGLRRNSLQELRDQRQETREAHEDAMAYLRQWKEQGERRDVETQAASKRRDEEMKAEFARRDEEMREFNREILLRNEKVYTAMIAQLEENTERIRSGTEQIRSNTEETRAQTQTLLRVIDRLDETGGAAAA